MFALHEEPRSGSACRIGDLGSQLVWVPLLRPPIWLNAGGGYTQLRVGAGGDGARLLLGRPYRRTVIPIRPLCIDGGS
jgi:hypothetical protein